MAWIDVQSKRLARAEMIPGHASMTAQYMALFRALESLQRQPLFDDPYAKFFLSPTLKRILAIARIPVVGRTIPSYIDRGWPGVRSSGIARTALIDESVRAATARGVRHVVLLGAGYDCRAYRMPELGSCDVFEVDHPDTQRHKKECIIQATGHLPKHVRFVATDFNMQTFKSAMESAGFDPAKPSIFIWEGVTNYLNENTVDAMLRWIASCAGGSELVFTYADVRALDDPASFERTGKLAQALRDSGEPWTFGIDPKLTKQYLADRGLELLDDASADEYRARYLKHWKNPLQGHVFNHVALARVP
jgi:methyltransferase (TIGR00027 family)